MKQRPRPTIYTAIFAHNAGFTTPYGATQAHGRKVHPSGHLSLHSHHQFIEAVPHKHIFKKFILVATALVGSGASSALAAVTPAQCYEAKASSATKFYQSAVAHCNNIAHQQPGLLSGVVNAAPGRGVNSYASFRAAVASLGVSVPAATAAELASPAGWNNYVKRVNATAAAALNANLNRCIISAQSTYSSMSAAARQSCGR